MADGRPTSFVSVNGVRLAYREWPGERGPLVCLPHLTGHKGSFNWLAERLAPDYRVLAVDLRGRGESDRPADGYGFAYHARDVLALADALRLESFAVVGHSFGATAAAYLASIRPDRVQAVVLMDGGADPKQSVLQAMYPTIRQLGQAYPSLADFLAAMKGLPFFQPWTEALEAYFVEDAETLPDGTVWARASAAAVERDMDLHFFYSMCLHFPHMLHRPTLFLRPTQGLLSSPVPAPRQGGPVGERGHVFNEREAAAIVRNIPNCRRVDLDGVNHYTLLINSDPPAARPTRAFLDEVVVKAAGLRETE